MRKQISYMMFLLPLKGFRYYRSHRKNFTERSLSVLLALRKDSPTWSISFWTQIVLNGNVIVKRNRKDLKVVPEMELQEGERVVLWDELDGVVAFRQYKVKNNKLVLEKW